MWWVEFDTNQTLHAAQALLMGAAMLAHGDFYYFVPTLLLRLEFGSCVQKKGTTAMQTKGTASCCFKGIIAYSAFCPGPPNRDPRDSEK